MSSKLCISFNVFFQVEIRNPRPQVHKTKETRHTTIRYPVFITQVIKPLLTQVETKVKPMFFTKTLKRVKTIVFTVTGIGQVTVTSVKYEKEYVTRCQKKGYGHGGGKHKPHGGYHRSDDDYYYEDEYIDPDYASPSYVTEVIKSPEELQRSRPRPVSRHKRETVEDKIQLVPSLGAQNVVQEEADMTKPLSGVANTISV